MTKRAYIIHGWGGRPNEGWFPWCKTQLEKRGYTVTIPKLPNADTPTIETWVPFVTSLIGMPDEQTILIGHSMGCQAILRYLHGLPDTARVGKVILVAGFTKKITGLNEEEKTIAQPWLASPIDFAKIKTIAPNITAIFSDNDPFVPLENEVAMREKLNAKTIIEHDQGHFSGGDGATELPTLFSRIS